MKPPASSASPVSASQDAAPASVTQISSSKPIRRRWRRARPRVSTALDRAVLDHVDAARREQIAEPPAHRGIVAGQHLSRVTSVKPMPSGSRPARASSPAQPMAHGERQLDAGRAAPDGQKPHAPGRPAHALDDPLPALRQTGRSA